MIAEPVRITEPPPDLHGHPLPSPKSVTSRKTPAASVSQVREVFTRLLRVPAPSPERIAAEVTRVLWRKETARIYKWHKATGGFPPRRPPPNTS